MRWLRRLLHKLFGCNPRGYGQSKWFRKLWGGHWERWYAEPCHGDIWLLCPHGTRPPACYGTPICEDYTEMPLSNQQQRAVEVLDWLLSEDDASRRTGRTTAMAVALIRQAVRHPGRMVYYMDHVPNLPVSRQVDTIRSEIQHIIHQDRTVSRLTWTYRDRSFRMEADRPALPNWWPDQGALPEPMPRASRDAPSEPTLPPLARTVWERLRED